MYLTDTGARATTYSSVVQSLFCTAHLRCCSFSAPFCCADGMSRGLSFITHYTHTSCVILFTGRLHIHHICRWVSRSNGTVRISPQQCLLPTLELFGIRPCEQTTTAMGRGYEGAREGQELPIKLQQVPCLLCCSKFGLSQRENRTAFYAMQSSKVRGNPDSTVHRCAYQPNRELRRSNS
jgi:hypothetical protein